MKGVMGSLGEKVANAYDRFWEEPTDLQNGGSSDIDSEGPPQRST